jgi:hypothetical protein
MVEQNKLPPPEPPCPPDRKPHRDRISCIDSALTEGQTGGVCIDNTEEHKAWYRYELAKYPTLKIVYQGDLSADIYLIKVEKVRVTSGEAN